MSATDYQHYGANEVFNKPQHVVVIKRYDNDKGGEYTAVITEWPKTEDDNGWETLKVLGFLKDHEEFRADLMTAGYSKHEFATLDIEEMKYITRQIVPLEWKNGMEVLGSRIQVYIKE